MKNSLKLAILEGPIFINAFQIIDNELLKKS